jgi:cell division protein ZapA
MASQPGRLNSKEKSVPQELIERNENPIYEFNFGGLPFKLRSSHDEEFVQDLANYVDAKIQQAMKATKSGSFQSAAVLAALNIAEELILLKRKALVELGRVEEKALKISLELQKQI